MGLRNTRGLTVHTHKLPVLETLSGRPLHLVDTGRGRRAEQDVALRCRDARAACEKDREKAVSLILVFPVERRFRHEPSFTRVATPCLNGGSCFRDVSSKKT